MTVPFKAPFSGLLESLNYRVTHSNTATAATEAMLATGGKMPDLILADVILPGARERVATCVTRLSDSHPAIKAVLMSGFVQEHSTQDALSQTRGANLCAKADGQGESCHRSCHTSPASQKAKGNLDQNRHPPNFSVTLSPGLSIGKVRASASVQIRRLPRTKLNPRPLPGVVRLCSKPIKTTQIHFACSASAIPGPWSRTTSCGFSSWQELHLNIRSFGGVTQGIFDQICEHLT